MSWPPRGVDPLLTDRLRRQAREVRAQQKSILDIDRDLNDLIDERNRLPPGSPTEGLLVRAEGLACRATHAGQPTYAMLAGKLCGEILLEMDRCGEALARLREVRAGYASVVHTGGASERANDVELLALMARAEVGNKDLATASATYGEAIAGIEQDRYQISTPYLQSAFLKGWAGVYARGVEVAFQLGDYETMLARAELSKARSFMRIQHGKIVPLQDSHLRRFQEVCDQIREIDPYGELRPASGDTSRTALDELLEERRRLWDLLAIARFGRAAAGPPFSLQAMQNAIESDTAILYYYWLNQQVLIATAITQEQVVAAPVVLSEAERKHLRLVLNTIKSSWKELNSRLQLKFRPGGGGVFRIHAAEGERSDPG